MRFQSIAMFCDDVREELHLTQTIVGVFPDTIQFDEPAVLPEGVRAIPRLGVYARTHVELNDDYESLEVLLRIDDQEDRQLSLESAVNIRTQAAIAKGNGAPFLGLVTRAIAAPFPVPTTPMRVHVVVRTPTHETIVGTLKFSSSRSPNA